MPTTSTVPFPRYKLPNIGRMPHLLGRDADLFRKFLLTDAALGYIGFDFDIKVGEYAKQAALASSPQANLEAGTLAKRIDAIAFHDTNHVDLIEAKAENLPAALGQLFIYRDLFKNTYPQFATQALIVITSRDDPEVHTLAKQYGITILVV